MEKHVQLVFTLKIPAMSATAKAPLGPTLGQYGIPIAEFCNQFNKLTIVYKEGVLLNCKVTMYTDQSYSMEIAEPDLTFFFKSAVGINCGWGKPGHYEASRKTLGLLTPQMVYEVCLLKGTNQNKNFKSYYKMCLGTLYSMGYLYI